VVNPELEGYRQQFDWLRSEGQLLAQDLTDAQFNWRANPTSWSIEECLSHLVMVGTVDADAVEKAIDQAHAKGLKAHGPFAYPDWERYILRESEPPVREAVAAPKRFVPLHGQPVTSVLPTFLHVQRRFLGHIERADGLDLRRVKVPTPVTRLVRMSLGSTLARVAAHGRRHLAQARKVRERLP
jgi:hypothetical protein